MNPNTGELALFDTLVRDHRNLEQFERIPRELERQARDKLARAVGDYAQVNVRSTTPLAQWAKKKRLAKLAAKSRRRNRHGKR